MGASVTEVFISYARDDEQVARRLAKALQASGLKVWWDADLPAHRAYSEEIERNLAAARAVVVLWSKTAAKSQWVRAEADFARNAGKLVQAQVDGTLPPMPFNQIQCADLKGWRGNPKHRGWAKLRDSTDAVLRGEQPAEAPASAGPRRFRLRPWHGAAAALSLLLLTVAVLLLLPRLTGRTADKPRLAVLPFEATGRADENLVDGIWEDTRQALSRNPQLIVIGRKSAEAMAEDGLDPRQYRSRFGIDYLLDGRIRHAGNRLRFSVSLVRTSDGVQVWSESFDRQLKDVFALQAEIAGEIEGRIRGRLARGGGTVAENIVTTPEVYALYNDARVMVRKLDVPNMPAATRLLKRAIQLDPNYAPAYATLAFAQIYSIPAAREVTPNWRETVEGYARRAIALAPNLAGGYVALGAALPPGPEAAAAFRRAVELDPNDADSLGWLAGAEAEKGHIDTALKLYDRAAQIEPLSSDVVMSRLGLLLFLNRKADVEGELERLRRSGAVALSGLARLTVLEDRKDLSEAARAGLEAYKAASPEDRGLLGVVLAGTLLTLQLDEVAVRVTPVPPAAKFMWTNDPRALPFIENVAMDPMNFWNAAPMTQLVTRNLVHHRRERDLVRLYKQGAGSPEKLFERSSYPGAFLFDAPLVAMALRRTGEASEADELLALADQKVVEQLTEKRRRRPEPWVRLARIRAVQGRREEAANALLRAVQEGWVSIPPSIVPELLHDPALALLKDMPQFRNARAHILNFIARERAELGPVDPEAVPMAPRPSLPPRKRPPPAVGRPQPSTA